MSWETQADTMSNEVAEFSYWRDSNFEGLLDEYTEGKPTSEYNRIATLYEETYEEDRGFERFIINKWRGEC